MTIKTLEYIHALLIEDERIGMAARSRTII